MTTRDTLKVEASMVLVPVTVADPTDHPVTDLPRGSFRVYEDNIEQTILSFHKEEGPVSVGIIFDASGSMEHRLDCSIAAIGQFLRRLMPGDEYFLIAFNVLPVRVTQFTANPDEILSSLSAIKPDGGTAPQRRNLPRSARNEACEKPPEGAARANRRR